MLKALIAMLMVGASIVPGKFSQREMSAEIYAMQSRLAALGFFNIKITGMYGSLTENSIKNFQASNGLEVTGVIDDNQLNYLYSFDVKPYLDSRRSIIPDSSLSNETFSVIDQRVTQTFPLEFVTLNKTATFKVKKSGGYLTGELSDIKVSALNNNLRYPVIATVQGVKYPASLDISSNGTINLHFKDSISYLGFPDSEHQYNINSLLGF